MMKKPLAGLVVAVTREETEDGPLSAALRAQGADVLRLPLLHTMPIADAAARAHHRIGHGGFDWVAVTSVRTVEIIAAVTPPATIRVAAVGEATAASLRQSGWPVHLIARPQTGEGLAHALKESAHAAGRLFLPAADRASEAWPRLLRNAGWQVEKLAVYRTQSNHASDQALCEAVDEDRLAAITFASPSAVLAALSALGSQRWERALRRFRFAAIGPTTQAALASAGVRNALVAETPSFSALADALAGAFSKAEAA